MKRTIVLLAILLLSFGLTSAQDTTVNIAIGGSGFQLDTIRTRGQVSELQISLGNPYVLGGMSLGFEIWSPDGAGWHWVNVGGLGAVTQCVTLIGTSRMGDGSVFDMTGFLVTEADVDELSNPTDVIMGGGVAMNVGLPAGTLEYMYNYSFSGDGDGGDDAWTGTLCFDSVFVPPSGAFVFVDPGGTATNPKTLWTNGGECWPVAPPRNFCPEWDPDLDTNGEVSHCGQICIDLSATDPEDDPIMFDGGSHDGNGVLVVTDNGDGTCHVCYTPSAGEVCHWITIVINVTDPLHQMGACEPWVIVKHVTNVPPTIDCGVLYNPVGFGNTIVKADIVGSDVDLCDGLTYYMCSGPGSINAVTGEYTWATTLGDVDPWDVCVGVTDGFDSVCCCFVVDVLLTEPYEIAIEKVHEVLQGHFIDVRVCLNKGSELMGGFDFLIGYDASALAFTEAALGDFFVQAGWEYFTYRFNWNGNCGNACPSGLLRIVGMAETNNGPNHPCWGCMEQYMHGENCYECGTTIATLTFFVSNDRTLECQFAPVRFYWMDCGDNVISVVSGDTLAINRYIYDIGSCQYLEIQDYMYGFPGYMGAPDDPCLEGDKVEPVRFIDFCNGGVDIVCADSIDARGDINVNGVANEIADAVMFTNYFINGLSAFGNHVEASIAASDVNADGIALSVADLVYLVRVIVGDANPYPKPLPETPVTISAQGGMITYNSPVDMGAALLTFQVNGEIGQPQLGTGAASMDMKFTREGNELRVLIYNIGSEMITAGENTLVTIPGEVELTGAEVATYDGFGVDALIRNLPRHFAVSNYPNPFNPKTTLSLALPIASDWSVKIYNIAGQLVRDYSGHAEAGELQVEWNGTDNSNTPVASGIYFYKAVAGQYSATKKMILMK